MKKQCNHKLGGAIYIPSTGRQESTCSICAVTFVSYTDGWGNYFETEKELKMAQANEQKLNLANLTS